MQAILLIDFESSYFNLFFVVRRGIYMKSDKSTASFVKNLGSFIES